MKTNQGNFNLAIKNKSNILQTLFIIRYNALNTTQYSYNLPEIKNYLWRSFKNILILILL